MKIKLYIVLCFVFLAVSWAVIHNCGRFGVTAYYVISGIAAIPFLIIQGGGFKKQSGRMSFFEEATPGFRNIAMGVTFLLGPISLFALLGSRVSWKLTYGDNA